MHAAFGEDVHPAIVAGGEGRGGGEGVVPVGGVGVGVGGRRGEWVDDIWGGEGR